jgi:type IV secretion system protein VirB6
VLTAITPLFVVLGGGLMTELLVPVVSALRIGEGINGRAAVALFMISAIHIALMAMVMRVIGSMVAGWQVFGLAGTGESSRDGSAGAAGQSAAPTAYAMADPREAQTPPGARRSAALVPMMAPASDPAAAAAGASGGPGGSRSNRTIITQTGEGLPAQALRQAPRSRGVGSRFRNHSPSKRDMIR